MSIGEDTPPRRERCEFQDPWRDMQATEHKQIVFILVTNLSLLGLYFNGRG